MLSMAKTIFLDKNINKTLTYILTRKLIDENIDENFIKDKFLQFYIFLILKLEIQKEFLCI